MLLLFPNCAGIRPINIEKSILISGKILEALKCNNAADLFCLDVDKRDKVQPLYQKVLLLRNR